MLYVMSYDSTIVVRWTLMIGWVVGVSFLESLESVAATLYTCFAEVGLFYRTSTRPTLHLLLLPRLLFILVLRCRVSVCYAPQALDRAFTLNATS